MKIEFVIYEIIENEVLVEGKYATDYKPYSETVKVLEQYDYEFYSTIEDALVSLNGANILNDKNKNGWLTILPIIRNL